MRVSLLLALLSANSRVLISFSRTLYLFICSQIIYSTHLQKRQKEKKTLWNIKRRRRIFYSKSKKHFNHSEENEQNLPLCHKFYLHWLRKSEAQWRELQQKWYNDDHYVKRQMTQGCFPSMTEFILRVISHVWWNCLTSAQLELQEKNCFPMK